MAENPKNANWRGRGGIWCRQILFRKICGQRNLCVFGSKNILVPNSSRSWKSLVPENISGPKKCWLQKNVLFQKNIRFPKNAGSPQNLWIQEKWLKKWVWVVWICLIHNFHLMRLVILFLDRSSIIVHGRGGVTMTQLDIYGQMDPVGVKIEPWYFMTFPKYVQRHL